MLYLPPGFGPAPGEPALAFYHHLAERLRRGLLSADEAADQARSLTTDYRLLATDIERLRAEAESMAWYAPRRAWALAYVAWNAALSNPKDQPGAGVLYAECALTLGITLNALGRFADAVPHLQRAASATGALLAQGKQERASRCNSELALSYTWLGHARAAQTALAYARRLNSLDDPLARAYCDWAESLIHLDQGRYVEAAGMLQKVSEAFVTLGREGQAALVWCDLADTLRSIDPQQALLWLGRASGVSIPCEPHEQPSPVHAARCDYVLGVIYDALNRYPESLALFRRARAVFAAEGMDFFAAGCDRDEGVTLYRLTQYEEALEANSRARAGFAALRMSGQVSVCDLNRAVVLYALNRYAEALALYEQVADDALIQGRALRAAHCYSSMGLCYAQLGRYDRALVLHDRARATFLEAGSLVHAALCQQNLAGMYRRLGRYEEALEHFRQAREVFVRHHTPIYLAQCDTDRADLYLALGRYEKALACLQAARRTYARAHQKAHVAICDREMARALMRIKREPQALALLAQARAVFADRGLLVDAALCDLAMGEAALGQGDIERAMPLFTASLAVLETGLPDEVWRAHYGLGRCALAKGDRALALAHWLPAVAIVQRIRAAVPAERLSGGFFADRRPLYEATLTLALETGAIESALSVAEASKAQTFLGWSVASGRQERSPRPDAAADDPYLNKELKRKERLRREMEALRSKLSVLHLSETGPALRSEEDLSGDQPEILARLGALSQEYEQVVERLRLAVAGQPEGEAGQPFSLAAMREAAAPHLPQRWACLEYYLLDDALIRFYLDPDRLTAHIQPLSAYDRLALRQCGDTSDEFRQLIYQGTIRGHPAHGGPGQTYLQHLYRLLIPPEVEDLGESDLLIIAPHGLLHTLPFHALMTAAGPLVAHVTLAYAPSLSALQLLFRAADGGRRTEVGSQVIAPSQPPAPRPPSSCLALGLSDFGGRARPLPHAHEEITALRQVFGERVHSLWGGAATQEALLRLNETGTLAGYDVIHFATHAVLDPLAPSQSRILLASGDLTFTDILDLKLRARLVVLAACQGALGQRQAGDEVMGLAQAFFFAGARSVIASLWPVEDGYTVNLMGRFYRQLSQGEGVAQALRSAQVEMAREGYVPYQWAPFIAIGLP